MLIYYKYLDRVASFFEDFDCANWGSSFTDMRQIWQISKKE